MTCETRLNQSAVAIECHDHRRTERAVGRGGFPIHRMPSGAGHDAMIVASRMPAGLLFLRSPGGISHHPAESVREPDRHPRRWRSACTFLDELANQHA